MMYCTGKNLLELYKFFIYNYHVLRQEGKTMNTERFKQFVLVTILFLIVFLTNLVYGDEEQTRNILKQGLLGAGVGAISAGSSGGKAGQGALIGAGTAVIGNALLDTLTQPTEQRRGRVYRRIPRQNAQVQEEEGTGTDSTRKKIIRKYDENGKVVSEEEIYY